VPECLPFQKRRACQPSFSRGADLPARSFRHMLVWSVQLLGASFSESSGRGSQASPARQACQPDRSTTGWYEVHNLLVPDIFKMQGVSDLLRARGGPAGQIVLPQARMENSMCECPPLSKSRACQPSVSGGAGLPAR